MVRAPVDPESAGKLALYVVPLNLAATVSRAPVPVTSNDTVTEDTPALSVASTTTFNGSVKPTLAPAAGVWILTAGGV